MLIPAVYLCYLSFQGELGAEPVKELNHQTGSFAFYLLLGNLLIGILKDLLKPTQKWFRFFWLERRYLGVLSFVYLMSHVFFYFALEAFEFQAIQQIYTKTYLIFGSLAFLTLLLLTATSMDWVIRKMGSAWKKLHRWVYVASLLFTVHIMLIEKADLVFYGSILLLYWLVQILRWIKKKKIKPTVA